MGAITTHTTDTPRIYVACLVAYNNGILHGAWIDADQDAWGIWDGVKAMLSASPIHGAEEWAIHDYDGFGKVRLSEWESFEQVAQLAAFITQHGDLGEALLAHFSDDLDEARDALQNRYLGCVTSLADYVQELTEDTTRIPEVLRFYIDWEAMARDAELSGDLFTVATGYEAVHVFAGC